MTADRWTQIKELFHETLARAPETRAAFLRDACADDAELRAEVERLIGAHAEAGSFIEHSPIATAEASPTSRAPLEGRVVGHYEIVALIGAGGMGEVYEARDTELGRTVALKVMSSGDAAAQASLRREAQHASQLNHPHICTIHEVGEWNARAYVVMEYVDGQPLSELIASDGSPVETVLRYGIQIADALAHAHQHGIIHRDLKSANVAITAEGRAKVLDFGLARRLPARELDELTRSQASDTAGGLVAGTLAYMAPELLRGETADARSDIWALGVVLYEMVAGRRPFTGATGFHLSGAILHEPPPPLPDGTPPALAVIIRRCLAKDPRERYQHAGEIRSALEAVQAERSGVTSRAPLFLSASRFVRSPLGATLALAMLIVLVVASAWRWGQPEDTPVAIGASGRPAIAVMHFENAARGEDTAWLSQGVPSMLVTGLAQTRGVDIVTAQRLHEALKQIGRDNLQSLDRGQFADVARRAGAGAVVVGSIFRAGSEFRIDAQVEDLSSSRILTAESVRGTDVFALVDQLASRIREGIGVGDGSAVRSVAEISSASLEAYRLYSQAFEACVNVRWDDAQKLYEDAVAVDPNFAKAYLGLALVNYALGRPAARREYLRKAVEHADRLTDSERLLVEAELALDAGNSAQAARLLDELISRFPDVEEAYASAYGLYEPLIGTLHDPEEPLTTLATGVKALPASSLLRNLHGYALLNAGRSEEAVREFETYVQIAPREANPYDSLGEAHLMMGLPEKALEYYARALTIDQSFSSSRTGRAWAWGVMGRYQEALAEEPPNPFLKAFILSRVGRYREAAQHIAAGAGQAEVNENIAEQGSFSLLSAVIALEQKQHARAMQEIRAAEQLFAELPDEQRRVYRVIAHLVAGVAEARADRIDAARLRHRSQASVYNPAVAAETSWFKALEGEIALEVGDLDTAMAAYSAAEPGRKAWSNLAYAPPSVFANNLPLRDGRARVMKARGDLASAIQVYRRLLSVGPEQTWTAILEPRWVLELARLLEQTGDTAAARQEYERFTNLWKDADPGSPELQEARRAFERLGTAGLAPTR